MTTPRKRLAYRSDPLTNLYTVARKEPRLSIRAIRRQIRVSEREAREMIKEWQRDGLVSECQPPEHPKLTGLGVRQTVEYFIQNLKEAA